MRRFGLLLRESLCLLDSLFAVDVPILDFARIQLVYDHVIESGSEFFRHILLNIQGIGRTDLRLTHILNFVRHCLKRLIQIEKGLVQLKFQGRLDSSQFTPPCVSWSGLRSLPDSGRGPFSL